MAGFLWSLETWASSEQSEAEGHDVERQDAQEDQNAEQKDEGKCIVSVGHVQTFEYELGVPQVAVELIASQGLAIVSKNGHRGPFQTVLEERYVKHPPQKHRSVLLHQKEPAKLEERADEEGSQNGAQLEAQCCSHRQANALRDQSRNEHNQEEHSESPEFQRLLGHQICGHYEQGTANDLDGQVG